MLYFFVILVIYFLRFCLDMFFQQGIKISSLLTVSQNIKTHEIIRRTNIQIK